MVGVESTGTNAKIHLASLKHCDDVLLSRKRNLAMLIYIHIHRKLENNFVTIGQTVREQHLGLDFLLGLYRRTTLEYRESTVVRIRIKIKTSINANKTSLGQG